MTKSRATKIISGRSRSVFCDEGAIDSVVHAFCEAGFAIEIEGQNGTS
jgi:hypothetical protein